MAFALSSRYERWVSGRRLSWMGQKARAIMGGLAAVLGDKTIDWATQMLFEHLPQYASAPSVALRALDLLIDAGPDETTAELAVRLMYAFKLWAFAGKPLGTLLALHYAGFDGAVVVQQNGRAYQLTLPLPAIGPNWDPTPNQVVTICGTLIADLTPASPAAKTIPAGNAWWTFDGNNDFCSRFAVLFPAPGISPSADDLLRLRSVIKKWKPSKATCVGIYSVTAGVTFGWPVRKFGAAVTAPSSVTFYSA